MSLEQSIDRLTAAVENLIARLDARPLAQTSTLGLTDVKPIEAKAAKAPAEARAEAPAPVEPPKPAKAEITLKQVQQRIMRAWPDPSKRSKIQAAMKAFGLEKLADIPDDVYPGFVARLREEDLLDG
jgi:hypothetical protein